MTDEEREQVELIRELYLGCLENYADMASVDKDTIKGPLRWLLGEYRDAVSEISLLETYIGKLETERDDLKRRLEEERADKVIMGQEGIR